MNNEKIPQIRLNFINIRGQHFNLVREIAYKKGELYGNVGKFMSETKTESNLIYGYDSNPHNGVYIYQSYTDDNIGYRIYKAFADYGFNGYNDDKLIQQLLERSSDIKLTKFPTGVVTLDGRIIGQEIPYFNNYGTLLEYIQNNTDINPVSIYIAILNAIKEMYDNGIIYLDNHAKNFLLDFDNPNKGIETIDFEDLYVKFDDNSSQLRERMLESYIYMINALNKLLKNTALIEKLNISDNFDDVFEELNNMNKVLTR